MIQLSQLHMYVCATVAHIDKNILCNVHAHKQVLHNANVSCSFQSIILVAWAGYFQYYLSNKRSSFLRKVFTQHRSTCQTGRYQFLKYVVHLLESVIVFKADV